MKTRSTKRTVPSAKITFDAPPLTEVVVGVQFEVLPLFTVGHAGKLWQIYEKDYPECREQPAVVALLEQLPDSLVNNSTVPTLMPRLVFARDDKTSVLQVQRDAFYYNWQKTSTGEYPRYDKVISSFEQQFKLFTDFIESNALGSIKPIQFELTYFNEIPSETGEVNQLMRPYSWTIEESNLPAPESINLNAAFIVQGGTTRLHSNFRTFIKSKPGTQPLERVYNWTLIARGCTKPRTDMSLDKMRNWFDNANESIVAAFVHLSTPEAQQKLWEKTLVKQEHLPFTKGVEPDAEIIVLTPQEPQSMRYLASFTAQEYNVPAVSGWLQASGNVEPQLNQENRYVIMGVQTVWQEEESMAITRTVAPITIASTERVTSSFRVMRAKLFVAGSSEWVSHALRLVRKLEEIANECSVDPLCEDCYPSEKAFTLAKQVISAIAVLNFNLATPNIVASPNGNLGFHWKQANKRLDIEILNIETPSIVCKISTDKQYYQKLSDIPHVFQSLAS